jgi:rubrerythrin
MGQPEEPAHPVEQPDGSFKASREEHGQDEAVGGWLIEQAVEFAQEMERAISALRLFEQTVTRATRRLERWSQAYDKSHVIGLADMLDEAEVRGHKAPEVELQEIADGLASPPTPITSLPSSEGVMCENCGALMQRTGSCYTCPSCGNHTGCG